MCPSLEFDVALDSAIAKLPVRVAIGEEFGWRRAGAGKVTVWTKGYGRGAEPKSVAERVATWDRVEAAEVEELLNSLDGHFAIVIQSSRFALAAVDWVRSIPIAYARIGDHWRIDDQALRLRDQAKFDHTAIDDDAALSIAMAGYTVDTATLYNGLHQLGPGEFALFSNDGEPRRHRYYCYRPWRADKPAYDAKRARTTLKEITLSVVDDFMKELSGRELVVPLSAGRDSRLIVSAVAQLGYRNVRCFAYGRPGNFEARASKAVADRLGFPWRFVPSGVGSMRRYFGSQEHRRYMAFADTVQSTPFCQDLPQVRSLKENGFIPTDAVICNGNGGDFISGSHIVPAMQAVLADAAPDERLERVVRTVLDKHFALWGNLVNAENRARITPLLRRSLARAGALITSPQDDYGLYEYCEFQDRQCKYVMTDHKIYEFLGHEWRLPLWSRPFLDFWESVPLEGKIGQTLYRSMLESENWGGVWQGIPVNAKTIKPDWIRPIRFAAKLAHAPLGRERWHRFERRYFNYWMSASGASAIVSYCRAARDGRGARHEISWLTEDYLSRHLPPHHLRLRH